MEERLVTRSYGPGVVVVARSRKLQESDELTQAGTAWQASKRGSPATRHKDSDSERLGLVNDNLAVTELSHESLSDSEPPGRGVRPG